MKIETVSIDWLLPTRWAIKQRRYKRAEDLAEAHKWFYEKAKEAGLYHPETKISVVRRKIGNEDLLAFEAEFPDLELLTDPIDPVKEALADDTRHEAYRYLDRVCADDANPKRFINYAALDNYAESMGFDPGSSKVYLTTLLLIQPKYPAMPILLRHKEETGIDLTGLLR
ncbi:MAG TPA: hypothetical protein VJB08_04685 [Candidatus Nanoarchaeia archaeon]|nr:hypothetical protein [Candidatus Nanoarchaeia archaeon]